VLGNSKDYNNIVSDDGAENSKEIDIDDLSPEKLGSIFSWSEEEESQALLEVSEGEKREPSFGSLANDNAPAPERDNVFQEDESSPRKYSEEEEVLTPPSFKKTEKEDPPRQKEKDREFLRALTFLGKVKRIKLRKRIKAEESTLGIDLSPPKRGEEIDPPSSFQELLQPLTGSELVLLQKDVQADESVYVRINKARSDGNRKQRWAILLSSILALAYFLSLGPEYLTETLTQAQSNWLPEALSKEIRGQIVFALGLLLPILSFFVLSEGIRVSLVLFSERSVLLALRGVTTILLATLSLFFLSSGSVLLSGITLLSWWLFKKAIKHPWINNLKRKIK
jgi:hypothetical protein